MKTYELIAPCHFGLEAVLKREIDDLGYNIIKTKDRKETKIKDINEKFIQTGKVIPEWNFYVMDLNALCESSLYVYYVDAPAKGDRDGASIMEQFQKDFEQYMKDQGVEAFN